MDVPDQKSDRRMLCAAATLKLSSNGLTRDFALHDIAVDPTLGRTEKINSLIETGFDGVQEPWSASMSIPDRQIALFRLAFAIGAWPAWFADRCTTCGEEIDLRITVDEFEISPSPRPVPAEINVECSTGRTRFRVPTGGEEAARADDPDADLFTLCACENTLPGGRAAWEEAFERALSEILPGFNPELSYHCPECGEESNWWFDPIEWIVQHSGQSLWEVDLLAQNYGWSESAILTLPEARRRRYISLIEARQ